MKNINLIEFFLLVMVLLSGCSSSNNHKKDTFQSIYIKKDENCNKEVKLYYTDSKDVNYYTMCLSEIILKFENKEMELKEALNTDSTIMNDIINKLTQTDLLYDGGTSIYKDFGFSNVAYSDFGNTGFTIIKCNAMYNETNTNQMITKHNKDYYFGDLSLEYEEGYCSRK